MPHLKSLEIAGYKYSPIVIHLPPAVLKDLRDSKLEKIKLKCKKTL
jgi:hypothetical protein